MADGLRGLAARPRVAAAAAPRRLGPRLTEKHGETFAAPDIGDPRSSTQEWKADFAHRENMRELARELSDLLGS